MAVSTLLQTVPGLKPAESALETLIGQGALGALVVILTVALGVTIRLLLKEKDQRVSDQKAYTDALKAMNDAAHELTLEVSRSGADQMREASRDQEAVRMSMDRQQRAFEGLSRTIEQLKEEQVRLGASLGRRG